MVIEADVAEKLWLAYRDERDALLAEVDRLTALNFAHNDEERGFRASRNETVAVVLALVEGEK